MTAGLFKHTTFHTFLILPTNPFNMALRIRTPILPSKPQSETYQIQNLLQMLHNKINLRPVYQRTISWSNINMNNFIESIMNSRLIPGIIIYKLQPDDLREIPTHRWECVDGQHRVYTLENYRNGVMVSVDKKQFMITWEYKDLEKKETTHVFYKPTPDTEAWIAEHSKLKFAYMTDEEKDYFDEFKLDVREIKDSLTLDQRREIFIHLQQGVHVRGSDLCKNYTHLPLIRYIVDTLRLENDCKELISKHCHLNTKKYWLHWVIRMYCMVFPSKDKDHIDEFLTSDTTINKKIKNRDPRLNSTSEQETVFKQVLDRFVKFMNNLSPATKLSPCQLFAVFHHLRTNDDSREVIVASHLEDWGRNTDTALKNAWEGGKRKRGQDEEDRRKIYLDALEDLDSIKVCASEIPPRRTIPKNIRTNVWFKHFGNSNKGTCECCREEITQNNWELAHIIAHVAGGTDDESNMLPTCRGCNRSMGIMNLYNYKKRYYPDYSIDELTEKETTV